MSNIKFKSILIVDKEKEQANKIFFGDKLNIITSTENSVGKSSLSLMLLYAFGAKVEFSDKWNLNNIFTKLELTKGDLTIIVERYKDSFIIFDGNQRYSYSFITHGYSDKLYEILDFSIKIKNKNDDSYSTAVPSIYLLPYYIPQTYQVNEKSIFSDLLMYKKSDIFDSMYFHVGILDKTYVTALIEATKLRKEKQKLSEQINTVEIRITYLQEKLKSIDSNTIVDNENNDIKRDVDTFERYSQKKQEYYELLKEEAKLLNQQKLLEKSKKTNLLLSEKVIESDEIRCPNCNSDITDYINTFLDIGYANDRITKELLELKSSLAEIRKKLEVCKGKLDSLSLEVNRINEERQKTASKEEVVYWNKELSAQKNLSFDLNESLKKIDLKLKEQEKIIKAYLQTKNTSDEKYRSEYKKLLEDLNINIEDLDLTKVKLYQSVSLSGSEIPRLAISKFIAYLRCKNDKSVGLPIMVDFPNLDLTNSNIDDCFKTIFNFVTNEEKDSQSFIFSIECLERLGRIKADISNAKVINFDSFDKNQSGKVLLLSNQKFVEHLDEINDLLDFN